MTRTHSTRRRFLATAGTALSTVLLAGCSSDGDGNGNGDGNDGDGTTVGMTDDLVFDPDSLQVPSGTTVTWVNEGDVPHTVTAYEEDVPDGADYFASGGFDSETAARDDMNGGLVEANEEYTHTFEVTGTYEYFCIPHEGSGMKGTIVVE